MGAAIGLDYRPALINREGIGRAVREAVRAHARRGRLELGLFGATLAASRFRRDALGLTPRTSLFRVRVPSRLWSPLHAVTGLGADRLVGGPALFHHTQPSTLPVARAVETVTLWDCLWKEGGSGWIAPEVAARMERSAAERVATCARIQTPSEYVRAELVHVLGADPERIDVVPLGADHVLAIDPDDRAVPDGRFLLTAARVDPRKNHVAVLRALELLVARGHDLHWVVAGPAGHAAEEFATALTRSAVRSRVDWRREVDDAQLAALYRATACFVFPSLGEGFGLPPLEAAQCGAPVVSSDRGSLAEVLPERAHLVEPRDADAIAAAIEAAFDERRVAPGEPTPFTWDASAAAQEGSWARALEQPTAPAAD